MMAKVAPWKKGRVSELAELLSNDGIVGIVDIGGVPAGNMLGMRNSLRDRMTMTMAKKTLIRIAWEQAGLPEDGLDQLLDGAVQPCIVHSESLNSFGLFAELDKTRQGRAAKEGEKAPSDIVVEKGPTEFGPGPIVGEFNAVGIPAKIDKGKVAIQKTVTVVNEGETISGDLGIMLAKLGITPIEIGLILTGAIEDGVVFPASSLDLDLDGFKSDVISATSGAFNLACNTRWFSTITMPTLLSKASSEAMSVAIEAGVVNDDTVSLFITRANAHAMAISGQLDSSATSGAFNLACNTRWFSTTTVPTLLTKASSEAMSVAIEAGVVNDDTVSLFITRANAHAMAISGQLDSSALESADAVASDAADSDSGAEAPVGVEEGEEE